MRRDWIEWTKRAGVRAVKTVAQAAMAAIGAAAVMGEVDWKYVISTSALAGAFPAHIRGRFTGTEIR